MSAFFKLCLLKFVLTGVLYSQIVLVTGVMQASFDSNWMAQGTNLDWSHRDNWSGPVPNNNTVSARFLGDAGAKTVNVFNDFTINRIEFRNDGTMSSGYTINGALNTLTIDVNSDSGITDGIRVSSEVAGSSFNQTINTNLFVANSHASPGMTNIISGTSGNIVGGTLHLGGDLVANTRVTFGGIAGSTTRLSGTITNQGGLRFGSSGNVVIDGNGLAHGNGDIELRSGTISLNRDNALSGREVRFRGATLELGAQAPFTTPIDMVIQSDQSFIKMTGISVQLGTLEVRNANLTIDFAGASQSELQFSDSSTVSWSSQGRVEVVNFDSELHSLRFGSSSSALTPDQLSNIRINGETVSLGPEGHLSLEQSQAPVAMYLSWQQDPTTTMTIQWHSESEMQSPELEYRRADGGQWAKVVAESRPMPYSDRYIHTVELTQLAPESYYNFRLLDVDASGRHSPFYSFRTMPATIDKPLRIGVGGDVLHRQSWMEEMNRVAMRYDLDFIVWGGDLAYADGRPESVGRWYAFFDAMMNTLIEEDGRVVPVVMGIGNHEVRGGYYWRHHEGGRDAYENTDAFRESIAPYFYSLFAFPGHPGYGVLDFGDYLSLIILDSHHSGPIDCVQRDWLEQTLADRQNIDFVYPVYHVPAYPSARNFNDGVNVEIREHWVPLFEQYGIQVAFENHDHTYKRTVPILSGSEDPEGIVYIGDGAWGVGERTPRTPEESWYLHRTASMRHFILVTLQESFQDFKVISREGNLIDHYIPPLSTSRRN